MGYVPPKPPDFGQHTATLYTLARIFDVGDQFLMQSGVKPRRKGTYEDYIDQLYGHLATDWFTFLNYGFLGALIAAFMAVVWLVVR